MLFSKTSFTLLSKNVVSQLSMGLPHQASILHGAEERKRKVIFGWSKVYAEWKLEGDLQAEF